MAASHGSGTWSKKQIVLNDLRSVYFYAPSRKPLLVEICEEMLEPGDEDMCGEVFVSCMGKGQQQAIGNSVALATMLHWSQHVYSGIRK